MPNSETPKPSIEIPEARVKPREVLRLAEGEVIQEALASREGIAGLRAWRGLDSRGRGVRQMRKFLDRMAGFDRAVKKEPAMRDVMANEVKQSMGLPRPDVTSGLAMTRVEELQALFLAKKLGEPMPVVRPEVKKIFDGLQKARSAEGEIDVSDLLTSSVAMHGTKTQWFESQLVSAVRFLERQDLAEARKKAEVPPPDEILEEKEKVPDLVPPPERDSFAPSMEEMERAAEGEPGAYFTITPFYGGYYKEGDFDRWNSATMQWERLPREFKAALAVSIDEKSRRVVYGIVRAGARTPLPMPYGFVPDILSLRARAKGEGEAISAIKILEDGRGGYVVETGGEGLVPFSVEIGRGAEVGPRVALAAEVKPLHINTGRLSEETERALEEIKKSGRLPIEQARMLKQFVRRTLKYSNESAMNAVYHGGDPAGYFRRIEEHKKADCDVANTYFLALLSRLEIPARIVTGHYVKIKNHAGAAVISSGTGHAWAEVWDGAAWQRLDATPPGDPAMDEEETDEKKEDETFEGDFGEVEAEEISDEKLEQMMAEARKALEAKERAPEEQRALSFAKDAGCAPEEAKQILKQIEAARELRDRQGRKIRDRIVREFQKVVQANSVERLRYKAPVRLTDGHELVDPVEAMLDLWAGEAEPTGFAKYERKIEREQVYGGFDVIFVVDKSGSMVETDPKTGQAKWAEQQKLVFLSMDALQFAASEFRRAKIKLISPIDVRVGLVSFQAGRAQVELPLGTAWGPKEQYRVWKALQENVGGGTPDHLGLGAAQQIIEQDMTAHPKEKNRLRLVLVSADGGSDNVAATVAAKEALKSLGVVVKAAGIGPGAEAVEATYLEDGKNLDSFDEVPDWAGSHVLVEAKKLFPKKVKK